MRTMTSTQTPSPLETPAAASAHAALFSEPEVVTAVVVPGLDPSKVAAQFSDPL